jgi:peptidase A4-like protein
MKVRRIHAIAALALASPLALAGSGAAMAHATTAPLASSPYLAGYTSLVKGSGSIESITVPAFTCPQGADARVAFGIADQGPDDAQPVVRAAVDAVCNAEGGTVEYGTEVTVPGQSEVSNLLSPGDVLTFSITYGKHHEVVASVVDHTDARGSLTITGTSPKAALHFGALPVVEGDNFLLPVPDFGRTDVVHATADGAPLTSQTAVRYKRVDDGQTAIVATGFARRPPSSGSFSLVFKAS